MGVLTHNENSTEGIEAIMDHLHQFVPVDKDGGILASVVSAGDLQTCEREENVQEDRREEKVPNIRWGGLIPVIADFHFMANVLQVSRVKNKTLLYINTKNLHVRGKNDRRCPKSTKLPKLQKLAKLAHKGTQS